MQKNPLKSGQTRHLFSGPRIILHAWELPSSYQFFQVAINQIKYLWVSWLEVCKALVELNYSPNTPDVF